MQKLTFRSIGKILEKPVRRKLLLLAIARIAANLLDLLGLAGIALLATAFGSLASGSAERAPLNLPLVGEWYINEYEAVFIAMGVAVVFLLKSGFSIWLNLQTSLTVAGLEGKHSRELAESFFSPISKGVTNQESVAEFQNRVMYSTGALTSFLNARITFMAEASLLVAMVLMFLLVNPIATVSMFLFMGGVLLVLNRMINIRIVRNGQNQMRGYEASLQTSRDLFGVKREALSAGVAESWLEKFTRSRYQAAQGGAVIYTLNSLPRYVVETSLILGIFAFIGGVVVFSDLPSQAITIGVFLAGGLRLIASVLPLQAAISMMKDGANRGHLAYEALVARQSRSEARQDRPLDVSAMSGMSFNDVHFKYPTGQTEVLSSISLTVHPLTKVAIVGRSGAGKSTIFDLATGFLEPTSGEIKIGNHTPREILFGAPGTFGIVTQRPHLVTGSLVENVSLVDDSSSDRAKVEQSLNRAGLSKFTSQPNWWELQIKPDSGQLSGGEIQRLGLARALYRDPKILFLDEATSALDAETEAEITKVLQELKNEMTVVLIAHRLSTVMGADKIIYLDSGRIVAEGTFQELKASVPDFARAVELMDLSDK
ncbi:ABC transporter ATP-binding protein [Aquiluna sp. KACHI24]|uniref:ATP-binding cassette domain-containing protein n=1 Tax=Aquiluna sp. KACHI24 TaxID=2968831 RepID=UPI00220AB797|nr:ABC transporter ATP-binding protein [Aquiluna sp. KACHI24]BDQ00549.1 ABC transporter ATP-binding protein [Aquiluna sp. KACHI24]